MTAAGEGVAPLASMQRSRAPGPRGFSPPVGALRLAVIALFLGLLTFAVFAPAIDGAFLEYDDPGYVTNNAVVKAGLTWQGFRLAWTRSYAANWHPLTWLSLMADVQLFGLNPHAFHFENVLLHAVNAALLFLLLRALTGTLWTSLLTATLFAVHPLRVESVAWIAERKDVLSMFFGLLAFLGYVQYARRPTARRYLLATLSLALGLAAKPMLVTWPLLMLVLDAWPLGRLRRGGFARPVVEKLPWFLMGAAVSVVTVVAQARGGALSSSGLSGLPARLPSVIWGSAVYLGKTLWPVGLSPFYPARSPDLVSPAVLGSALVLAGVTLLAAATVRRRPWLAAGWCWYLIALAPVSGIVQVGSQAVADRYTYVPLIGPTLALALALRAWAITPVRRAVAVTLSVAACLLLVGVTRLLIPSWRNSEAVFTRMVDAVPGNYAGYYGLGRIRQREGRIEEAERFYLASIRSNPSSPGSRMQLGGLYLKAGRREEAEEQLRVAVRLNPREPLGQSLLGNLLVAAGRDAEAIAYLQAVVRLQPNLPEAFNNLGVALAGAGRSGEAADSFRRALEIWADFPEARANLEALSDSARGRERGTPAR